ncbi:MAG: glycosyltransferase 87 family protein [Propionibacteriaceae bacterium]|jgi:hypothetical protein|nr:glycosyltransferase 87 family protein [Propionibacteriaceae bacterium]
MDVADKLRPRPRWLEILWSSLKLPTHQHALGWWIGTRAAVFLLWAVFDGFVGDVSYYYDKIAGLFHGMPPSQVLVEYPTPLIWILSIPYLLGLGTQVGYSIAFVTLFLAGDALMGYVLWRGARQYGTDPRPSAAFWIWFVVAIGPIIYMRLDFLTAALSAAAVLAIVRQRRASSGALIGVGAAIKLWPALLWPATMVDRRAVKRATIGFAASGLLLAAASWLYAGWDRLISPLTWQSDRGLQIESIYATPLMVARLFRPEAYTVEISSFNAYEIDGPGGAIMMHLASWATVLGGVLMLILYIGWLRRRQRTAIEAGTLMIIATLVMIITNKTFSPQYMIWLAGPVAALLTISARHPELLANHGRMFSWLTRPNHLRQDEHLVVPLTLARHIATWTIVLMALTQLVFPLLYAYLVAMSWATPLATIILTLRNVTLIYFTVRLIALACRSIAFPRPEVVTA